MKLSGYNPPFYAASLFSQSRSVEMAIKENCIMENGDLRRMLLFPLKFG
jgi:hypothetical protein